MFANRFLVALVTLLLLVAFTSGATTQPSELAANSFLQMIQQGEVAAAQAMFQQPDAEQRQSLEAMVAMYRAMDAVRDAAVTKFPADRAKWEADLRPHPSILQGNGGSGLLVIGTINSAGVAESGGANARLQLELVKEAGSFKLRALPQIQWESPVSATLLVRVKVDERVPAAKVTDMTVAALKRRLERTTTGTTVLAADARSIEVVLALGKNYETIHWQAERLKRDAVPLGEDLAAEASAALERCLPPDSTWLSSLFRPEEDDQRHLDALRERAKAQSPATAAALDRFINDYKLRMVEQNSLIDLEEAKLLFTTLGVLEFRIMADNVTGDRKQIQAMEDRLRPDGKGPESQPGDTMQWTMVGNPSAFRPEDLHEWKGKQYALLLATPEGQMIHRVGDEDWRLASASAITGAAGDREIAVEFDSAGGRLFGKLTDYWVKRVKAIDPKAHARLAIVLDNKVLNAPNINDPILGGSAVISGGGRKGFSEKDQVYLVSLLNAGWLPAPLELVQTRTNGEVVSAKLAPACKLIAEDMKKLSADIATGRVTDPLEIRHAIWASEKHAITVYSLPTTRPAQ